jgi:hypothetical protein
MEIVIPNKKYDSKKYYENFREKHMDIINKKMICADCLGKYTYFNKSHHTKTKKHLKALEEENDKI